MNCLFACKLDEQLKNSNGLLDGTGGMDGTEKKEIVEDPRRPAQRKKSENRLNTEVKARST
jgi:hypothetical protein